MDRVSEPPACRLIISPGGGGLVRIVVAPCATIGQAGGTGAGAVDGPQADEDSVFGRRRSRRTTTVANRLMSTLVSTGDHFGGRPRRMASVSMKMPLHVGQRHAPERRPIGCMTVPSFGHFHAVSVSFVTICPPLDCLARSDSMPSCFLLGCRRTRRRGHLPSVWATADSRTKPANPIISPAATSSRKKIGDTRRCHGLWLTTISSPAFESRPRIETSISAAR